MKLLPLILLCVIAFANASFAQTPASTAKQAKKLLPPSDDGEIKLIALDGQGNFILDATAFTNKRSNLSVYNLKGELITTAKSEGSRLGIFTFSLEVSKSTVYFYQLIDEDGRMAGGKISIK